MLFYSSLARKGANEMSPENFCYWLRGFTEIHHASSDDCINLRQWEVIKEHLNKVFNQEIEIHGIKVKPVENFPKRLCSSDLPKSPTQDLFFGHPGVSC